MNTNTFLAPKQKSLWASELYIYLSSLPEPHGWTWWRPGLSAGPCVCWGSSAGPTGRLRYTSWPSALEQGCPSPSLAPHSCGSPGTGQSDSSGQAGNVLSLVLFSLRWTSRADTGCNSQNTKWPVSPSHTYCISRWLCSVIPQRFTLSCQVTCFNCEEHNIY